MQARRPGGHFGAVTLKRARIVPQKKAIGPTSLGCICDKDLFVLVLVFTPECDAKIRTKKGFCAPKRELCPKRKQLDRYHWGAFVIKSFLFWFWSSPPNMIAKFVLKEVFVPPSENVFLKRKQQDSRAWYGMEWKMKWNGTEISVWNMEDARMEWNGRFQEWNGRQSSILP